MQIIFYWKEILAIFMIVLFISIEPAYRQPLYDYSLDFIVEWQDNGNKHMTSFFKFISQFGTQNVQAGIIIAAYCFASRRFVMKLLLTIFVSQNILTFFKVFYHNPRPFFSSNDVSALSCSIGYGNPSGHCLLTIGMYGTLWFILFSNNTEPGEPLLPRRWQYLIIKWLSLFLVIALMILTFFARLYLGVHGLNQTIYGSTLGIFIIYAFGIVLPKYVNIHYDEFIRQGPILSRVNKGFIFATCIVVLLQILNVILFFTMRDDSAFMNEDWIERIRAKCPKIKSTPLEDSFKGSLHASLYVFIYLTQIFNARLFPKAFNYWYSNIGFVKMFLRTVILLLILLICFIPYLITNDASFTIKMWLAITLTNVLIGFLGAPLIDWITEKLGLFTSSYKVKDFADIVVE